MAPSTETVTSDEANAWLNMSSIVKSTENVLTYYVLFGIHIVVIHFNLSFLIWRVKELLYLLAGIRNEVAPRNYFKTIKLYLHCYSNGTRPEMTHVNSRSLSSDSIDRSTVTVSL